MKILMPTYGTHGDVLPFLAIGRALAHRGHEVVVFAPAPFARPAEQAGLQFCALGSDSDYQAFIGKPEFYKLLPGLRAAFALSLDVAGKTLRWIESQMTCGDTVVVAPPQCFGARIAQERFGLPTATLHVTPLMMESRIASPRLPGLPVPSFLPAGFRHWLSRGGDRYVIDRMVLPALNAFRAELGLRPVRRLRYWWNSPTCMLLTFPEWYAPTQLDWPLQAVQVGFPLADRLGEAADLPEELSAFLDGGTSPLVFVYSSWSKQAKTFFATAVEVCRRLGRRGVFLAPQVDQVPPLLPPFVIHVPYAPLSLLLPRCSAIVHHGGIGTVAQALAAGVPQVVIPFMGDHFDEAERIRRIGVGGVVSRHALSARRVARVLQRVLGSGRVKAACELARLRIIREDSLTDTCSRIEALALGPSETRPR